MIKDIFTGIRQVWRKDMIQRLWGHHVLIMARTKAALILEKDVGIGKQVAFLYGMVLVKSVAFKRIISGKKVLWKLLR